MHVFAFAQYSVFYIFILLQNLEEKLHHNEEGMQKMQEKFNNVQKVQAEKDTEVIVVTSKTF